MNHQSHESHPGFAGETSGAVYPNGGVGQFYFNNSGGVVIPEIRRDNQTFQDRGRQNAEVAKPRIEPYNQMMDGPVELVEKLEDEAFGAESPRSEDHFVAAFGNELFQQAGYVGGRIFAVRIHNDHWGGDATLLQVNQTYTYGALVPKVGSQFQTLDPFYVLGWSSGKLLGHWLQRAVIDEDDLSRQRVLAEDGIELLDKKPSRCPIVENRHQNR